MTYAERIAIEHIGYRQSLGWSESRIRKEARRCLLAVGLNRRMRKHGIAWAFGRALVEIKRPGSKSGDR